MYKFLLLASVLCCTQAYPLTQEELAQYVARQQTAGPPRRQPYVLQAQPRQVYQQHEEQPAYQPQQQQQYYQPQPQAQPQQYVQPQYVQQAKRPLPRPLQVKGQPEQEPEDYDPNPQYQFAFDIKDDEFTNYQQRKEQREGDKISGSYSVVDADGFIRTVTYTADPLEGFKANVERQPTDIKVKIPTPAPYAPQQVQAQYAQYTPHGNLVARKQQTQQYLQASAPVQGKPQYVLRPEHTQAAFATQQQPQVKQISPIGYSGQPLVAAPKSVKASAIGFSQQPTASPILYQAYQQ